LDALATKYPMRN